MSATGKDQYRVFLDEIDKPVFTVDTATPKSHQIFFQRLGFADSIEWISHNILDELIERLTILLSSCCQYPFKESLIK